MASMKLNARWALPVYPVFKDEKSNGSDEKSVKRKIAQQKTNRTNIRATNLVSQQLFIASLRDQLKITFKDLQKMPHLRALLMLNQIVTEK